MKTMFLVIVVIGICLVGCEGDQGPTGPIGPQGEEGPAGEGGTRIVYESTSTIPESPDPYCVSVPEIKLEDMPLVGIYIGDGTNRWWQVPISFPEWQVSYHARIEEGKVCFIGCHGWRYRIVVIK